MTKLILEAPRKLSVFFSLYLNNIIIGDVELTSTSPYKIIDLKF